MQADKTTRLWLIAYKWVNFKKKKIYRFIGSRYYLNYSPYPIEDFISECYIIAYEALSKDCRRFRGIFWNSLKNRCKLYLANQPHKNLMYSGHDISDERHSEYSEPLTEEQYTMAVSKVLNILTPRQRQICRLIAFSKYPMNTQTISTALGISVQAVEQRLNNSIKTIEHTKTKYGGII